jgi:hypothetical protein
MLSFSLCMSLLLSVDKDTAWFQVSDFIIALLVDMNNARPPSLPLNM